MIAIARYSSLAAGVMAMFLFVAAFGSLLRNEPGAQAYLMTALLTIFGAGCVYLAVRNREVRLDRFSSYLLLLLLWVLVPVIAAIPIAATTPMGPIAAWMEATSAFTTTGALQIHDLEKVPHATVGWLLTLQWLGGLLTLIGFVAIIGPAGIGGLPDHGARTSLLGVRDQTDLLEALKLVLPIYFGATVLCTFALFAVGLPVFDALGLAGAALSTGGVLPRPEGMAAYGHFAVKLLFMVFMLVGGTSVLWHSMLLNRRLRMAMGQQENIALLIVALLVGVLASAIGYRVPFVQGLTLPVAIEDGIFTAVALVTTTGVEPHPGAFASLPLTLVMTLVFIGGATFSTAGGIKMYRAGAMLVQSYLELERLVHPNAVHPRRLGQQHVTLQMMKAIWIMFGVACTVIAMLTVAIASAMPSFEAAFVAIVTALGNAGPIYSAGWTSVPWPDWEDLPAYAQMILAFAMILGRLEILVVLGLANFVLWRR